MSDSEVKLEPESQQNHNDAEDKPKEEDNSTEEDKPSEEGKSTEEEWMDVLGSGQIMKKVIKPGEKDTRPRHCDVCNIRLVGHLDDFDGKIVEQYDSLRLQAGDSDVIQGIDLTIQLMDVGEIAQLKVEPRFGYGSLGLDPDIPPNATLYYEIELLKSDPEPDLEQISFTKRRTIANCKRERGNWWYSRQDHTKAILCYKRALEILDDSINYTNEDGNVIENVNEEMLAEHLKDRLVIYNNLAAAQMMTKAYDTALDSVNSVLKFDPKNVKGLFRKGKILAIKGETNEAVDILREACQIEPENNAIKKELQACIRKQQEHRKHEKDLYKKMLGQDKNQEKPEPGNQGNSKSWRKTVGAAVTATVIVAVAAAVGYRYKAVSFF